MSDLALFFTFQQNVHRRAELADDTRWDTRDLLSCLRLPLKTRAWVAVSLQEHVFFHNVCLARNRKRIVHTPWNQSMHSTHEPRYPLRRRWFIDQYVTGFVRKLPRKLRMIYKMSSWRFEVKARALARKHWCDVLNTCNMQSGKSLWEQAHCVYLRCYSNTQLNLEDYNKNAFQSFITSALLRCKVVTDEQSRCWTSSELFV